MATKTKAIKYYVFQYIWGANQYLRIDESGTHWMEDNSSNATPLSYARASLIARQNNLEAQKGGYYGRWGITRTDSIWH